MPEDPAEDPSPADDEERVDREPDPDASPDEPEPESDEQGADSPDTEPADAEEMPEQAPEVDLSESWVDIDDPETEYQATDESAGPAEDESAADAGERTGEASGADADEDDDGYITDFGVAGSGEESAGDEVEDAPDTADVSDGDETEDADDGGEEDGPTDSEGADGKEGDEEGDDVDDEGDGGEDAADGEEDGENAEGDNGEDDDDEGDDREDADEDGGEDADEDDGEVAAEERDDVADAEGAADEENGETDDGEAADDAETDDTTDADDEATGEDVDEIAPVDESGTEQVEYHDDTTPIQRKTGPESDKEQPLADHIEEMIKRLAIVVVVAGLVSLAAFPFGEEFINFLWYSVLPSDISKPHVYHPLELVITQLKAASLLGLVLALPVFVYETYAFMRPGLYPHERRYYLAAVPTSLILAFIGLLFGYFLVLPAVMTYFLYYSEDVVDIAFALGQTFNLMLILLGYLALVFQIPLFIMLAIMMGLTTRTWLEDRRLIFWGAFLGISFLFSPDPTGMAPILVAATMIALFEGTLLMLRWTKRGG